MAENNGVKKRNASRLSGKKFDVDPILLKEIRGMAVGWKTHSDQKLKSTLVDAISPWDLELASEGTVKKGNVKLTLPGARETIIPVIIKGNEIFLDHGRKIKQPRASAPIN